MTAFLIRRLFSMVLVWIGVTILTFLLANVVPSDPVALRLGPKATPASIAQWRHEWGLDQPLPNQYIRFVSGLFHGDLGVSVWSGRPILNDLKDYLPATLELALAALSLATLLGIPMGILSTLRPGGAADRLVQLISTSGLALPLFWFGLLLQLLFYRKLGLLPLEGRIDLFLGAPHKITGLFVLDSLFQGDWVRLVNSLWHLILPATTLALPAVGSIARMMRASTLEVMNADFIRTAKAKGVPSRRLLWRHAFRTSLLPVVTVIGNLFNAMLAGAFVVEAIFNWPGLGWYATKVILASDYGSITGITLVIAVLSTIVNLIVDILYRRLDPRIQLT